MHSIARRKTVVTRELHKESILWFWKERFQVKVSMHVTPLLAWNICQKPVIMLLQVISLHKLNHLCPSCSVLHFHKSYFYHSSNLQSQFQRSCSYHDTCFVDLIIIKSCFLDYQIAMHISVITYLKDEAKEIFHLVFRCNMPAKPKLFQVMLYEKPQTIFFLLLI